MTTDPATEPLRFAYWLPDVSGGLVNSTIDQRTGRSFDFHRTLARLAERRSDWYFSNGKSFDGVREQLADRRQIAAEAGRSNGPSFGLNGFVIVRDTERDATGTLREIMAEAHVEAVEGFGAAVRQAGQSTSDKKDIWADSTFEGLVQHNDGFRTGLIGTPEQVATRIVEYRQPGVDLILTGFPHYHEEAGRSGRDVLPIVRELEVAAGLDPPAVPDPARGRSEQDPVLSAAG